MKYTFEIMKEYEDAFKGISVYSVSKDNKLMVDFVAREELEDAQKQVEEAYQRGYDKGYADKTNNDEVGKELAKDIYQRGLDAAWEAARKMVLSVDEGGLSVHNLTKIFGSESSRYAFRKYSASEAIEKLKAFEEKQKADDEIRVKDEVVWTQGANIAIVVTSIYTVDDVEWCDGVCKDGKVYSILTKNARKTGRRFDIDKILEAMKE